MYTFAAGIRRLPVKQPCRGADMAYWRRRESGFSGQNVTGGVTGSGKEVQVKVSGKVSVWGRQNLIFETGIRQKIIRPVTFVRKVTAFRS